MTPWLGLLPSPKAWRILFQILVIFLFLTAIELNTFERARHLSLEGAIPYPSGSLNQGHPTSVRSLSASYPIDLGAPRSTPVELYLYTLTYLLPGLTTTLAVHNREVLINSLMPFFEGGLELSAGLLVTHGINDKDPWTYFCWPTPTIEETICFATQDPALWMWLGPISITLLTSLKMITFILVFIDCAVRFTKFVLQPDRACLSGHPEDIVDLLSFPSIELLDIWGDHPQEKPGVLANACPFTPVGAPALASPSSWNTTPVARSYTPVLRTHPGLNHTISSHSSPPPLTGVTPPSQKLTITSSAVDIPRACGAIPAPLSTSSNPPRPLTLVDHVLTFHALRTQPKYQVAGMDEPSPNQTTSLQPTVPLTYNATSLLNFMLLNSHVEEIKAWTYKSLEDAHTGLQTLWEHKERLEAYITNNEQTYNGIGGNIALLQHTMSALKNASTTTEQQIREDQSRITSLEHRFKQMQEHLAILHGEVVELKQTATPHNDCFPSTNPYIAKLIDGLGTRATDHCDDTICLDSPLGGQGVVLMDMSVGPTVEDSPAGSGFEPLPPIEEVREVNGVVESDSKENTQDPFKSRPNPSVLVPRFLKRRAASTSLPLVEPQVARHSGVPETSTLVSVVRNRTLAPTTSEMSLSELEADLLADLDDSFVESGTPVHNLDSAPNSVSSITIRPPSRLQVQHPAIPRRILSPGEEEAESSPSPLPQAPGLSPRGPHSFSNRKPRKTSNSGTQRTSVRDPRTPHRAPRSTQATEAKENRAPMVGSADSKGKLVQRLLVNLNRERAGRLAFASVDPNARKFYESLGGEGLS